MNDDELITTLRESVTGVHMAIPEEQIARRSRTIRARRRIPAAAGALAVAAGAVLAVTAPSGHQPGHPASARLAAWTVARQADGDIHITINQLQDPAGLQSTLRADGLPVNVSFSDAPPSTSCRPYDVSRDVLTAVVQPSSSGGSVSFVIDPSALPTGTGLSIYDNLADGVPPSSPAAQGTVSPPPAGITGPLAFGLVYASQRCTG